MLCGPVLLIVIQQVGCHVVAVNALSSRAKQQQCMQMRYATATACKFWQHADLSSMSKLLLDELRIRLKGILLFAPGHDYM